MIDQLRQLFDSEEHAQRLLQQITLFSNAEHVQVLIQIKIVLLAGEQLAVHLVLRDSFMQIYAMGAEWRPVALRVVYGCQYPKTRPRLYFESDNMNLNYTIPGRDYLLEIEPNWSQESTLLDLLPALAFFLQTLSRIEQPHYLGTYIRSEYISLDCLHNTQASELYRVKIISDQPLDRFILLNRYDLIVLEPSLCQGYLRLVDAYALKSIISIHNSQFESDRVIVLFKLGTVEMGCQVITDERERFVASIIDKKNTAPNYDMPRLPKQPWRPQPIELDMINEQIAIEQSKLDEDEIGDSQAVNYLVCLYNQAIQYCSLVTGQGHEDYLQKLQRILSLQGSHLNQIQNVFPQLENEENQKYFYDKLHDLTQVNAASADLFDLY